MSRREDPRRHAAGLLLRALGPLPATARTGRIRLRADVGYFAGELARAALFADVQFAVGAWRPACALSEGVVGVPTTCHRAILRVDVHVRVGRGHEGADPNELVEHERIVDATGDSRADAGRRA